MYSLTTLILIPLLVSAAPMVCPPFMDCREINPICQQVCPDLDGWYTYSNYAAPNDHSKWTCLVCHPHGRIAIKLLRFIPMNYKYARNGVDLNAPGGIDGNDLSYCQFTTIVGQRHGEYHIILITASDIR